LKDLQNAGIPLADVIYMAHGVEICGTSNDSTYGVRPNFAMFNGKMLLDEIMVLT
jgi:hypothetical protein